MLSSCCSVPPWSLCIANDKIIGELFVALLGVLREIWLKLIFKLVLIYFDYLDLFWVAECDLVLPVSTPISVPKRIYTLCVCIYIYIYVCVCVSLSLSLSLSLLFSFCFLLSFFLSFFCLSFFFFFCLSLSLSRYLVLSHPLSLNFCLPLYLCISHWEAGRVAPHFRATSRCGDSWTTPHLSP